MFLNKKSNKINIMKRNKKKNLLTNIQPATDALLFWSGFTNNIKHNNKKASKLNIEIFLFTNSTNFILIMRFLLCRNDNFVSN